MSRIRFRMRISTFFRMSVVLGLGLLAAIVLVASETATKVDNAAANGDSGIVKTAPLRMASRVQLDPKTGELQAGPAVVAPLTLTPELRNSLSTSTVGLQIETGAGGGKMVRLQGRFRHLSSVTSVGDSAQLVRCFDGSLLDSTKNVEQEK